MMCVLKAQLILESVMHARTRCVLQLTLRLFYYMASSVSEQDDSNPAL